MRARAPAPRPALRWALPILAALALAACQPGDGGAAAATTEPDPAAVTPATTSQRSPAVPGESHWQCGDQRVAARVDPVSQTLTLIHERGQLSLPQAAAASGTRYADANGNEFWSKAAGATLTLSGTPARECTTVSNGAG